MSENLHFKDRMHEITIKGSKEFIAEAAARKIEGRGLENAKFPRPFSANANNIKT